MKQTRDLIPTVFLVDDDHAVRDSIRLLLKNAGLQAETFENAETFLETYKPEQPGCLVLDLRMPGMSGVELQEEMNRRNFPLPVIFLSAHGDIPTTVRTIQAGAADFLTKPVQPQILLERIQMAIVQDVRQREQINAGTERNLDNLTQREMEVAKLLAEGRPNKEIARHLCISHRTVEIHRARVMEKTRSANLIELAQLVSSRKS